ncbi:membrane Transport [Methylobacterium phyllosphaerae]|uniref:Cobalt transporter subunit CbtA n=1 Tax=Methylobacterium phyllosphaerae TaxID=418223 RepID=A0AAE8HSQ2_9HYPH|nr:CbtA family protein [Methylobacterium phyllosphaerae]APT31816.1 membrane Transport [Methylobacterium phyllosphaerae]SFH03396.1 cobalt transporter subunit CbtA [Methylobacterium phyllosphaerae]
MIIRLLSAALAAGFFAAAVVTGLELTLTSPLIVAAERYEQQEPSHQAAKALPIVLAHAGHDHAAPAAAPEWQPGPGLPRMAFTGLATLVGGVGYALLLGAVMIACGREPTPQVGLAFAVAGFASVALAPGLGLPPELPGSAAAPLAARQAWWVMTAAATGMGLYLITIRRALITILGGLVLIITPHVVGAPQAPEAASELPAALAAQFAARSLAISFVFWILIGLGLGWAWQAFSRDTQRGTARA